MHRHSGIRRASALRFTPALALVLCGIAAVAFARTSPNPDGRLVRDPRRAPVAPGGATSAAPAGATSAQFVNVPLAAGAIAVDSTYYDLQDMGSLGTRIVVDATGRVHLTWEDEFCELGGGCPPNLASPSPHPNRAMGYAWRDESGVWHRAGKVRQPSLACGQCAPDPLGGFGAMAVTPSGRAAISQHMNEDGCDLRGAMYLQSGVGATTWQGYLAPIVSPSMLFPQIAASANGSFTLMGEEPVGGQYDETTRFQVSYLAASGQAFVCPVGWQFGNWVQPYSTALFRDGRPAFPSIATSSNGRVGIAVGDFGGNVFLIESSNGTFAAGTITTRNLTNTTDAQVTAGDSTSTQFRAYVHCHLAYNDTTPNVVWAELQARRVGGVVRFFDHRSRIRHWSPERGVQTVYQLPAGVADRFDDVDLGLSGPLAGFNTLSVDWPQVGFSADGSETYVAFLGFRDSQVDPTADMSLPGIVTGVGFGDIWATRTRAGEGWLPVENLTNTPNTDERFFSLATRNPGGKLHLTGQASTTDRAGVSLIGDRGLAPGNLLCAIFYMEPTAPGTVLDAPAGGAPRTLRLTASPNPVLGGGRVRLELTNGANRAVDLFDLNGRRVARVRTSSAGTAEWDGRDWNGSRVPTGVYFARLADRPDVAARIVVAR